MSTKRPSGSARKRRSGGRQAPDVTSPRFAVEAHRQSLAIARSCDEKRDQEFVDAISDDWNHD